MCMLNYGNAQCINVPSNWAPLNVTQRIELSRMVVQVKVLSIINRVNQIYGETYDIEVTLLCTVKSDRGQILPLTFIITEMGERPNNCPSRNVVEDEDYVIFLRRSNDITMFIPDEVNQEQCVWESTYDNLQLFPGYLTHCFLLTGCAVTNPATWLPRSIPERAEGAEIIVKVRVNDIHYFSYATEQYTAACQLQCIMKQPSIISPLPDQFNVTSLGILAGQCSEKNVTKGRDFIMFLQRHYVLPPLPGITVSPDQINSYILGPQEVNHEQAVFEATEEILMEFEDYMDQCENIAVVCKPQLLSHVIGVLISVWFVRN